MEKQNPIEEAQRYVDNAKQTLKENGELDTTTRTYSDRKYVRAAGHYLWNAVLIVMGAIFSVKTKKRPHPDIKDYRAAVATRDRKLLALVNAGMTPCTSLWVTMATKAKKCVTQVSALPMKS